MVGPTILVRGALLLAVAFAAAFLLRRQRAALRADLWRATFVALAALPLATLVAPKLEWVPAPWRGAAPAAAQASVELADGEADHIVVPAVAQEPGDARAKAGSMASVDPSEPAAATPPPPAAHGSADLNLQWLGWVWALVAAALVMRTVRGLWRAAAIARAARPMDGPQIPGVRLLASADAATPFVLDLRPFGSPSVVLPEAMGREPEEKRAALAHELAHVERRDGAYLLLGSLVSAFLWPTLLAGFALRRLRTEIELAADDAVLRGGTRPSAYATLLMAVETRAQPLPVTGMAGPPLARRIADALAEGIDRRPSGRPGRALVATIALAACAAIGSSSWAAQVQEAVEESVGKQERSSLSLGVEALLAMQDPETGAWRGDVGYKLNRRWRVISEDAPHVGVTGLAVQALVRAGAQPADERPGLALRRGIDFLLKCQDAKGYIKAHGSRMRAHAHALRGLAEALRTSCDDELFGPVARGLAFSVEARSKTPGQRGWRFAPFAKDADIIESAHQLDACRAAFSALDDAEAFRTAMETIERDLYEYADLLNNDALDGRNVPGVTERHGYRYQRSAHARTTQNTNLAGLVIQTPFPFELGDGERSLVLRDLQRQHSDLDGRDIAHFLEWDAMLLGVRAKEAAAQYEADAPDLAEMAIEPGALPSEGVMTQALIGRMWQTFTERWRKASDQRLNLLAQPDGSWRISEGIGDAYSTAIGCLIETAR